MSEQSLRIIVNGKPYLVEVDDLTASPISVRVNGKPFSVEIEPLRESPAEGVGEPTVVPPLGEASATTKAVGGPGLSVKEVIAPMPGNIMDIRVGVGDHVSYRSGPFSLAS
jgi:biotin carboxyl carrier protein